MLRCVDTGSFPGASLSQVPWTERLFLGSRATGSPGVDSFPRCLNNLPQQAIIRTPSTRCLYTARQASDKNKSHTHTHTFHPWPTERVREKERQTERKTDGQTERERKSWWTETWRWEKREQEDTQDRQCWELRRWRSEMMTVIPKNTKSAVLIPDLDHEMLRRTFSDRY